MSREHPDRDSLSAYLEEALSIDAAQWVEHHLEGCVECGGKLEQERAFLEELGGLCSIEPPADFTQGVMARVAQFPAYQPAPEVQWRRISLWVGSAAALMVVLLGFVGWVLVAGAPAEGPEVPAQVPGGIAWVMNSALEVYFWVRGTFEAALPLLLIAWKVLLGILESFRQSGLAVQLTLLLVAVGLNYWFTRLVLNYQRRQ